MEGVMQGVMQGVSGVRNPDEGRRSAWAGAPAARVRATLLATLAVLLLPLLEPSLLLRSLPAPEGLESRILAAGSCRPAAAPRSPAAGPDRARMVAPFPPRP
jgi:hypothetical protein